MYLARRAALDQVRGEREGAARESDDRPVELEFEKPLDGLPHERHGGARVELGQLFDVRPSADRVAHDRAESGVDGEFDPEAGERQGDVGEDHPGIERRSGEGAQGSLAPPAPECARSRG